MDQKEKANLLRATLANSSQASSFTPQKHSEEVRQILISIEAKLTGMDGRLSLIEILYQEFQALRESLESVSKHSKSLQDSVSAINNKLTENILELQARGVRDSFVFSGLKERTIEDPEKTLKEFIIEESELPTDNVDKITFNCVDRLGTGILQDTHPPNSEPKFQHYEENVLVQSHLKGAGFGQDSQFPPEILEGGRNLFPVTKETRNEDVQQVLADKGGVSDEQQEWFSSLAQESPQIKEEEEITDSPEFLLASVPVKSENEQNPRFSQLHQNQTDENVEVEPRSKRSTEHKTSGPQQYKSPQDTSSFTPECPESDNTGDWEDTRECQSFLNFLENNVPAAAQYNRFNVGEKLLCCPQCSKTFKFNSELLRHITTHTGEKPFCCSECGKRFGSKGTLRKHSKIHTGERPFSCSQCGKRFHTNNSLMRHMRVHSGHRPFHCLECGKTFRFSHHLKQHTRIHTGEKPYKCIICGKRCAQTSSLKYHMRYHMGPAQFR
ncbi:zinc finger protein 3-like isoform X2 [Thalassophryne amazonica]|uniref:zinc finger protein 3-like isoform X2 n=1 Tax=Thalassophryne amazonica TaxID=390379 RepID=UPI0014716CF1|nr:zinc finger protein 3-like isoform X2 [Thalassophryne amazonica]